MPCLLPPLALRNKGGGARRDHGEREVGPWGFDSPLQFRRRGPAGVGAAAMVAADELRPWAARVGAARGEWSWGKGRGGREEPSASPTLGRGDARRRGDGSGGGMLQCVRCRRCGLGERSWRWRRWSWGEGAARGGPFIAEERRWRGRAWVEAGERCGAPLMTFGRSLVS